MRVTTTDIPGVLLIEPDVFRDPRGLFLETYHARRYADAGIPGPFVQDNCSQSMRGTLRGLHYQEPHAQGKLVMATDGAIYDVVIDLRPSSSTFRQWIGVELSANNRLMIYIPEGFAHGFQTLEDNSEVFYQMSHPYVPHSSRGVRWDDPAFDISWPPGERIIIERDRSWPDFNESSSV